MAAKNPVNGRLVLTNGDTFTAPTDSKEFQPQGLLWSGGTGANHKAWIVDADGVTQCYMSIVGAGDHVELNSNFWGPTRPWKTPVTASMSSGVIFIMV